MCFGILAGMNMRYKISNKAFTLVELAIVLVIIGLIVGGVLAGQELIYQSKLRKIISEIGNYKLAINTFRMKYGQLPGDFNRATEFWGTVSGSCNTVAGTGTQTCNGNGDDVMGPADNGNTYSYETWRAWEHLSNASMVKGDYTGIYYLDCTYTTYCYHPGENVPTGPAENSVWAFIYLEGQYASSGKAKSRNALIYGSITGTTYGGRWHNPVLTTDQQYFIDLKIDDGMPYTGKITDSGGALNTPGCATSDTISATATYDLSRTDIRCLMLIDNE
jgi:prepilin-type N-terminal cleavage/methylation domain-containing protein